MRTRACRVQPDARNSRGSVSSSVHFTDPPSGCPALYRKLSGISRFRARQLRQGLSSALLSSPPAAQLAETSRFYAILIAFFEALCLPAP